MAEKYAIRRNWQVIVAVELEIVMLAGMMKIMRRRMFPWMGKKLLPLLSGAAVASGSAHAAEQELNLVDGLSQNAIQSAFQILRRDYIRRDELTFEELNRAALQGLLERLNFGADLSSVEEPNSEKAPAVHAEFLAPGVAYLRPESFKEGEGELFAGTLKQMIGKSATRVILDLRAGGEGLFEEAALILQCFLPEGEVMFKMRQIGEEQAELFVSRGTPLWTGEVVALVDLATGNAAEAVAAVLHQRGRVLLVGEKTRGATVRYTKLELDDKITLRYAGAEMLLPDDATLFKKGLRPAFEVRMRRDDTEQIIEQSRGGTMKTFVIDAPRPRYNEAALVHGGNPELDLYVQRSGVDEPTKPKTVLRDKVVQRAVDLLTAEPFVAGAKLRWNGNGSKPTEAEKGKASEDATPTPKSAPAPAAPQKKAD